jgi:hypothetical protein
MASKNTTLSAINRGGIATLADGTCWHISSSKRKMEDRRGGGDTGPQADERRNRGANGCRPHPTLRRTLGPPPKAEGSRQRGAVGSSGAGAAAISWVIASQASGNGRRAPARTSPSTRWHTRPDGAHQQTQDLSSSMHHGAGTKHRRCSLNETALERLRRLCRDQARCVAGVCGGAIVSEPALQRPRTWVGPDQNGRPRRAR